MSKTALEILNKYIDFKEDGIIDRKEAIKAMEEYAKQFSASQHTVVTDKQIKEQSIFYSDYTDDCTTDASFTEGAKWVRSLLYAQPAVTDMEPFRLILDEIKQLIDGAEIRDIPTLKYLWNMLSSVITSQECSTLSAQPAVTADNEMELILDHFMVKGLEDVETTVPEILEFAKKYVSLSAQGEEKKAAPDGYLVGNTWHLSKNLGEHGINMLRGYDTQEFWLSAPSQKKPLELIISEINNALACFEAANIEGLYDKIDNVDHDQRGTGSLYDLIVRRILPAKEHLILAVEKSISAPHCNRKGGSNMKLKDVDDNRKKSKEIILKLVESKEISGEEMAVLIQLHEDVYELTDILNYLGEEALKMAEKRKNIN